MIRFENLTLGYGNRTLIESLTGDISRGQLTALVGRNGTGKSTLLRAIATLGEHSKGEILIDGAPITEYTKASIISKIGIVPQKAMLFSGSIADNLRFGNENATEEEMMRAIETAQAIDVVTSKGGLGAKVEGGGKNFSGGQRQRLTIARALVKNPEILILDDSTSALDYSTDMKLRQAIRNLDDDTTVFIISQRTSSVMYADSIIVLDDGKVVGIGKHEELLVTSEVYREIYESQFGKEAAV